MSILLFFAAIIAINIFFNWIFPIKLSLILCIDLLYLNFNNCDSPLNSCDINWKLFFLEKVLYKGNFLIFADNFKFDRNKNILNANGNVKIKDNINDYQITGDDFTYFKNSEKIISKGGVKAFTKSKYKITSKDVVYIVKENKLTSKHKTKIEDQNSNVYFAEKFNYQLNHEILKGEEILIISNYKLPNSDKFFFKNVIFLQKYSRVVVLFIFLVLQFTECLIFYF